MNNIRRFSRVKCVEKSIAETPSGSCEVRLLDISLKGALVEYDSAISVARGDAWRLFFRLDNSEIILEFGAEVIHCHDNLAGVKFVEVDLETMIHLRSLMEARTVNPEQVRYELEFLLDED
jgi:hypothetical protein